MINAARLLNSRLNNFLFRPVSMLLTLSALTWAATAQTLKPVFPVPIEVSITGVPISTPVIADFNGDGIADLASLTTPSSSPIGTTPEISLSVILSFGRSTSTTVTTPLCSNAQLEVNFAVGDVNNDKKPDVVFTCNGYVTVLFGNGDGTFQGPAYYAVNTIGSPTLVDLNGDGYLDVAVLSNPSPQAAVFLNGGSGAPGVYGRPTSYSAGSVNATGGLRAGDFNGDGKQDLIAPTNSGFVLFSGNGDGTLQPAQNQPFPNTLFHSVTVGDFNHDGITDIAFVLEAQSGSLYSSVQILLGTTSGAFKQGADLQFLATGTSTGIATADLTGDGNLDLVVVNKITTILLGDGEGNFKQGSSYAISGDPLITDENGDGKQDLLLDGATGIVILLGNGDGTFQGIPATPFSGPSADVNGDGLADVIFISRPGAADAPSYVATALGRGDGTFAILNQSAALPAENAIGYFLELGDFNGDGKVDAIAVQTGTPGGGCNPTLLTPQDAQVFSYLGSGNGTFQAKGTGLDLGIVGASLGVVGDFNGDGKLDLILPYNFIEGCLNKAGLVFVPGNGDGTFATPVAFSQASAGSSSNLIVGDLNNDKKLDLIWANNDAVYFGNGDGTFKQIPLNLPSQSGVPLTIADLNGDGILDLVSGTNIYAGNGDGTFQSTPFYTVPTPQSSIVFSAAVGTVSGDNNPDLLELFADVNGTSFELSVSLGDGHGTFTQGDVTSFAAAGNVFTPVPSTPTLVRLNKQAPSTPNDQALDVLASVNDVYMASLLNQTNPAPSKPAPFTSSIALQSSSTSSAPGAAITLTATVLGINPTGTVSFSAGSTPLETATVTNRTAALQTSFANAGSYSVTASYEGDPNNSASISNAVSIVIVAPDFTVTALPTSSTLNPGQTATFAFTVTAVGGYTGTVKFSCGSLPSEATCSFAPASLTPANGSGSSMLTITTTSPTAQREPTGLIFPWLPTSGGLALAGMFCIVFAPRRTQRWNRYFHGISGALLLAALYLPFLGCGGGGGNTLPQNPGTPQGSYSIPITISDSAGAQQHTAMLNLMVQ